MRAERSRGVKLSWPQNSRSSAVVPNSHKPAAAAHAQRRKSTRAIKFTQQQPDDATVQGDATPNSLQPVSKSFVRALRGASYVVFFVISAEHHHRVLSDSNAGVEGSRTIHRGHRLPRAQCVRVKPALNRFRRESKSPKRARCGKAVSALESDRCQ